MSQTFFNQLTDLNDAKDGVKDYIFVNRWRGIGAPDFANAQGWETTQVNIDQYLSLVLTDITTAQADATQGLQDASNAQQAANAAQGDATTALAFVNAPISTDAGNVASLGTDNKVYVPAPPAPPAPAIDFKTIATLSTPVTIANTSAETIFPTNLPIVPSDNLVGALYELHFNISKGPAGHNSTIRAYINTSNNLSGSPVKVLEYSSGFNNTTSYPFMYRYFRNSIGLVVPRDVNAAQTVLSNLQTNSLVSTTPITFNPSLTYYIVITTQMGVNNSSETLQFAKLCLTK